MGELSKMRFSEGTKEKGQMNIDIEKSPAHPERTLIICSFYKKEKSKQINGFTETGKIKKFLEETLKELNGN